MLYFWGILFLFLTVYTTTTIPHYVGDGIELLNQSDTGLAVSNVDRLYVIGWRIIGLGVLLFIFRVLSRIYIFIPGRRAEAEVRQDYYNACITIPPRHLSGYRTGDLLSRSTNDVSTIRVLLSMGILHITNSVLMLGFCLVNMFWISARLTIICLLTLSLAAVAMKFLSARMMNRARTVQRQLGTLTETIRELLRAHTLLTIYPVFGCLIQRFTRDNGRFTHDSERLQRLRIFVFNISMTLSGLAVFILILVGGPLVIDGELTVADFVEYSIYLGLVSDPLRIWGFLVSIMQSGEVCLERVYEIRDLADRVKEIEGRKPVARASDLPGAGDEREALISIRNLAFTYKSRAEAEAVEPNQEMDRPAFALQIDALDIVSGRKYGIFGHTGSGKTTFLNLVTGNLAAPPGTCFFAGVDYERIATDVLLKQFAIAAQDNRHFDGSIRMNLDLVRDHCSDETGTLHRRTSFDDAYSISQLASDIETFRTGLETVVGEYGIRLSGGQRQRLAILRALLKPRRVLLLDDVISAVDHETEKKILTAMFSLLPDETMVIISHRISALIPCDEILVMEDGRIVDRGPHEALLERHAVYRATYHHQVVEQKLVEMER